MSTTPTPWLVEPERRNEGAPQTFRVVSGPDKVANEWRKDWYTPSLVHGLSLEDANLIAAAPELLSALRELLALGQQESIEDGELEAARAAACAAIKKAVSP